MTSKALPMTGPDDTLPEHCVSTLPPTAPPPRPAQKLLVTSTVLVSPPVPWSPLPPTRALWTLWVSPTWPNLPRDTG